MDGFPETSGSHLALSHGLRTVRSRSLGDPGAHRGGRYLIHPEATIQAKTKGNQA